MHVGLALRKLGMIETVKKNGLRGFVITAAKLTRAILLHISYFDYFLSAILSRFVDIKGIYSRKLLYYAK